MTLGHFGRSLRAHTERSQRAAALRVADWPAPRGRRGPDRQWSSTVTDRPASDFGNDLEAAAVAQIRACIEQLRHARRGCGLSLRQVSARTGIALSALTGLEQGSAWPTFPVLSDAAGALGLRVQASDSAVDADWPRAEVAWHEDGGTAGGWHQFVIYQLLHRHAQLGLSAREVALRTGLARETVTELARYDPPRSWASTRVLFALTAFYGTALEVAPRDAPWPTLQVVQ